MFVVCLTLVSLLSSREVRSFGTSTGRISLRHGPLSIQNGDIVFGRQRQSTPIPNRPSLSYPPPNTNTNTNNRSSLPSLPTALHSLLDPTVLTAASAATAKLLSSIGLGALATPKGPKFLGGVLDSSSITALSKLTYWMFQPAFLMCSVASTLATAMAPTPGAAASIPRSALLLFPLAALLQIGAGYVSAKLLTTKRFGVRTALLGIDQDDDDGANDIKMCTTFSNSGPLPLILSDALFGGGLLSDVSACVSFYLLVWSPLFWSFGRIIMGTYTKPEGGEDDGFLTGVVEKAKFVLSPPVVGSILGVVIGSCGMLRRAMLAPGGILSPVFGAANTFAVAYIPAAVLVLAGSLAGGGKTDDTPAGSTTKPKSSLRPKTVVSIMLSRFLLSPLLALATVRLFSFFRLLPTDDPRALAVVTFALLMEGCMPPAQNSVILLQLDGKKERAAKMAKMLTVVYALSVVPITLLLSGCLSLSGIVKYL